MTPAAYLDAVKELHRAHGSELKLRDPLHERERNAVYQTLRVPIAGWLAELWSVADGNANDSPVFVRPGFFTGLGFLSVAQAMRLRDDLGRIAPNYEDWEEDQPRDNRVRSGWFHDTWIPFAEFGGGTIVLFADHAPGPGGTVGQVLSFAHDPDQISLVDDDGFQYLGRSLGWFEGQADELIDD